MVVEVSNLWLINNNRHLLLSLEFDSSCRVDDETNFILFFSFSCSISFKTKKKKSEEKYRG